MVTIICECIPNDQDSLKKELRKQLHILFNKQIKLLTLDDIRIDADWSEGTLVTDRLDTEQVTATCDHPMSLMLMQRANCVDKTDCWAVKIDLRGPLTFTLK